jgi:hypothetical protein
MVDIKAALKIGGVEVLGICDVDSDHLATSADEVEKLQGTRPKTFKYYPDLLDMKGLDAVFIGTIPHWHALQFIAACNKGLDIYCEKPLAYDVMEGLAMVNAARKAGNIVQFGFQRREAESFKKAKELIEAGKIGEVHQIVAQIHYNPGPQDTKIQPPPVSLDWEDLSIPTPLMQENHVENFLKAVRNKDKNLITCTPEDAFQSTAAVQLAMISYNTGTIVKWDNQNKQIINNPEASALLKRAYRGKYIHP